MSGALALEALAGVRADARRRQGCARETILFLGIIGAVLGIRIAEHRDAAHQVGWRLTEAVLDSSIHAQSSSFAGAAVHLTVAATRGRLVLGTVGRPRQASTHRLWVTDLPPAEFWAPRAILIGRARQSSARRLRRRRTKGRSPRVAVVGTGRGRRVRARTARARGGGRGGRRRPIVRAPGVAVAAAPRQRAEEPQSPSHLSATTCHGPGRRASVPLDHRRSEEGRRQTSARTGANESAPRAVVRLERHEFSSSL